LIRGNLIVAKKEGRDPSTFAGTGGKVRNHMGLSGFPEFDRE